MTSGPDDDAAPEDRASHEARALTGLVAARYGLALRELVPIEGGWDPAASVWTGRDAAGAQYGVKVTTRDVTFGLTVAGSLAGEGATGIVHPRPTLDGGLWTVDDGRLITVFDWVDGVDAVDLGPDSVDWLSLGRMLRTVHDHPAPPDVRPHRRGIRRVRKSLRALVGDVDVALRDTPAALAERWDATRPRLLRLVEAERALKTLRAPSVRVTTHGDPHLGNVLLDADGRPWLIDFDEASIAPRELDLMLVELGVLFDTPLTDAHRALFREGYGTDIVVDRQRIARFGCVRAVEDATAAFLAALDRADPADPAPSRMLDGILGPQGLVTLVESELDRLPLSREFTDTKVDR
ncbi:phosphotransferase enzyme family protein [Microbacterium sp. LMI1-1-1.1]|uniref:phosphotransferase enzyme family protein n=1 Tax=Microbacterium sp. LMI1-1-1.1 TaxID=3135223 RepID=UPI00346632F0